jgi:hypothetical protein
LSTPTFYGWLLLDALTRACLQTTKLTILSFRILNKATPFLLERRSIFVKILQKVEFADRPYLAMLMIDAIRLWL